MSLSRSRLFSASGNAGVGAGPAGGDKPLHDFVRTEPFKKILIANRGEIACRIIRTAKKMGIKTVAVYSEADARSMHVQMADEAYCIGGNTSAESYLMGDRVLEIALKSGAEGIHPGYGFLSEASSFVDMVESHKIVFIGPSSHPMEAMGDKIHSKKVANTAKCFTIPGYDGEVKDEQHAVQLAHEIGYPVMIKASGGGGGKGMRVAFNDKQLVEGYQLSKAEAKSSFKYDTMLIERFIEDPHHIEIQVIADAYGNVAALPERECSIQRRNQKVVEESPSCFIDPETRRKMQEQAIRLCKAVNYRSAGTIEMLVDSKKNFYFLEMNTRLQVEHPISEMISGLDLVELMLRVGQGEKLPQWMIDNPHVPYYGWAVESRVYAEDPLRNFLPSIGPLLTLKEPKRSDYTVGVYDKPKHLDSGEAITRVDTGVYEGGVISMYYDPMISKLVTHAPTRQEAITAMAKALDQYVVRGLGNNLCFLSSIMRNKSFNDGLYSTKFIPTEYPAGFKGEVLTDEEQHELIGAAVAMHLTRQDIKASNDDTYEQFDYVVVLGGKSFNIHASTSDRGLEIAIANDNETKHIVIDSCDWHAEGPLAQVKFLKKKGADGKLELPGAYEGHVHGEQCRHTHHDSLHHHDSDLIDIDEYIQFESRVHEGYQLKYKGSQQEIIIRTPRAHELSKYMIPKKPKDFSNVIRSPMPGTLVSIRVQPGDNVVEDQILAVVEAMKMQNALRSPKNGVVKSVLCKAGSTLKLEQVIIEFEK